MSHSRPSRTLLIADDEEAFCESCREFFGRRGYDVRVATSGREALAMWAQRPADVCLLDWQFPTHPDGREVARSILSQQRSTVVVMITGFPNVDIAVEVVRDGALDYVTKPVNMDDLAARVERALALAEERTSLENAKISAEREAAEIAAKEQAMRSALFRTCIALARSLEAKSPYTKGHSDRVSRYASMVAQNMGLSDTEVQSLTRIGLLHDIGKIGVPDAILDKPGRLDDDEWQVMRAHAGG